MNTRAANATRMVDAMWPLLQRLEEANKAWLLTEVGCLSGELTLELARRSPWRDVLGLEGDPELLRAAGRTAGLGGKHRPPEAHRVDFARCALEAEAPRLPIHNHYASGLIAVGLLRRLEGTGAAPMAAEMARVLRPGGSLLMAEPTGGWLSGVPTAFATPAATWSAALDALRATGFELKGSTRRHGWAYHALKLQPPAATP